MYLSLAEKIARRTMEGRVLYTVARFLHSYPWSVDRKVLRRGDLR